VISPAKRSLQLLLLSSCLLFLPGCWDYQKINDRAQIIGIGVDPVPDNPKLMQYTIQVPVFSSSAAESGQTGEPSSQPTPGSVFRNFVIQATGMADAVAKAQRQYDKSFYLGNFEALILNRRLSAKQVNFIIMECMRNPTVDKLAFVVCTSDLSQDILQLQGGSVAPSDAIDRFLGKTMMQYGYTPRVHLWEFWRDMKTYGINPHAPLVKAESNGFLMGGMMAFQGSEPKVDVDGTDTLYYRFVAGKINDIAMTIPDGNKSFEVGEVESSCKMSVRMQGATLKLHADIRITGSILSDETAGTNSLSSVETQRYEQLLQHHIEDNATRVMKLLQAEKLDPYGFGHYLALTQPRFVMLVANHWPDYFARAQPDVHVHVVFLRKGNII